MGRYFADPPRAEVVDKKHDFAVESREALEREQRVGEVVKKLSISAGGEDHSRRWVSAAGRGVPGRDNRTATSRRLPSPGSRFAGVRSDAPCFVSLRLGDENHRRLLDVDPDVALPIPHRIAWNWGRRIKFRNV
ncbi:hypothetical protein HPP92_004436 [Vanilla planifolia]|uniref:Uncharacterized protein n=1 Tax=Vanilla planifolia TaxID=51239 RepID=A0A835RXD9_VANPL|nr:hypothetical protein HPP92_004436 [Vanilla planifolia]